MSSSYTTRLALEKQADGENPNSWGTVLNQNVIDLLDTAIAGYQIVSVSSIGVSLTSNNGAADTARTFGIRFEGLLTANVTVTIPQKEKIYAAFNGTTGSFAITMKTAGGTAVTVPTTGKGTILACDGININNCSQPLDASISVTSLIANSITATSIAASVGVFSGTLGVTGAATLSSTLAVTGAVTNSSTIASTGSISAPNTFGFKNRIINGAMAVDQRNSGASQTFTAGGALAYSVDRWYGYCTGANVTGQQVAGATTPTNTQFRYRFTGAASVTAVGFAQRIEQKNSYDLAGSTCTLSADLAISATLTTVTWTAYYATTTADTFGSLASPTVTSIATGTFTVGATVTNFSANINVPAAATTGIQILFTVGALTAGLTWTIGNVQLEKGTLATSFDWRDYSDQVLSAYRYFRREGYGVQGSAIAGATQFMLANTFAIPMRTTPTLSLNTTSATGVRDDGTATTGTSMTISSSGLNAAGYRALLTGWSGGVDTRLMILLTNCLDLTAEL